MKAITNASNVALALFVGVFVLPASAGGQVMSGTATAVDGDSLVVDGQKVRLFGIDAPEFTQTCTRDGETWECGKAAKEQLSALVSGAHVECRQLATDGFGRAVSTCVAGSEDVNRTMVEHGWAVAYREFSTDYVGAEQQAKRNGQGIWGGSFELPSDFRSSQQPKQPMAGTRTAPPRRAAPARFSGCVIKGNRNRRGEWIYHLPGMPYYEATRPEEIFCTEADAQAAGYRRAIVRP